MTSYRKDDGIWLAILRLPQRPSFTAMTWSQNVGREREDCQRRHGEAPFRKILRKRGSARVLYTEWPVIYVGGGRSLVAQCFNWSVRNYKAK